MSRSTVFAFAGATIGFIVTGGSPAGAQWGWIIGSGVGALTDNTKTYGPRAGDASQQTSQDGTICTYGYGEFPTTGVILWRDERKEQENEQGKGGPKQVTYSYTWSYAIGVCKGPIGGYLIIKRNGTIVFDARTNAELAAIGYSAQQIEETRAAQTKFLKYAKLYFGDNEQMPDPTMQAVKGVNNVPAYRGRAYIVLTDDPVTDDGAAIPQYEFVVASCGEGEAHVADGSGILITGNGVGGTPTPFITAAPTEVPVLVGIPVATGADVDRAACSVNSDGVWIAVGRYETLYSTDITTAWMSVATAFPVYGGRFAVHGGDGWLIQYVADSHAGLLASASETPTDIAPVSVDLAGTPRTSFSWINYTGGKYYGCVGFGGDGLLWSCATIDGTWALVTTEAGSLTDAATEAIRFFYDIVEFEGALYATCYNASAFGGLGGGDVVRKSIDAGATWDDLVVDGRGGIADPFQLCVGNGILIAVNRDVTKVWTSADGFTTAHSTGVSRGAADFPRNEKEGRFVAYASGRFFIMGDAGVVSTSNGIAFGAVALYPSSFNNPISIAAHDAGVIGREIPDARGHYVDLVGGGITGGASSPGGLQPCEYTLDEIVEDQCAIRDVTRVVVTELEEDIVRGFRVAAQTSPKDNIRSLMGSYFFDASDYDGYIHFLKRPQPDTFLITMDDLVSAGTTPIKWEITKENDLLCKVSISYFDPKTNYTITSQDFERAIATIKAQGEGMFDSALTATNDFTKQNAEKSVLVAWAERDMIKVEVRLNHAARVTGEWGKLQDETGQLHTVRITHIKNKGVTRELTLRKTRRSAYSSRAIGLSSPNPTFPGSGLRGPNVSALMNMPVLRPEDDKAGVYWACTGVMQGWKGSLLELSRSGGAWETGPTMTAACTMGELTEVLPYAPRYGRDDVNKLTVQLFARAPKTLASGTDEDLLAEKNAAALVYPSGKVEILQFKTATLIGDRLYELTGLYRGCKDTAAGEHEVGAIFVLLDDAVRFVAIRPDDVGKTLSFRSTSLGTDPDFADIDTLTFATIESLREWQPYHVVVTADGLGGFCVSWIGRGRLGNSRAPYHSQWFDGYEVKFDIGSTNYVEYTTSQSLCVAASTLAAAFPDGYGIPAITVRARSKVATNDDDFDSPPGAPEDPWEGYPYTVAGNIPDLYLGEPVWLNIGLDGAAPRVFSAYGGQWEQLLVGEVATNVWAAGYGPGTSSLTGVPLATGTMTTALRLSASGPLVVGDPVDIAQSVTVLAKPTYSLMDWFRAGSSVYLVDTTPPWTTAYAFGAMRSRAGFNGIKAQCEFVIAGITGTGAIVSIGVSAGSDNSNLSVLAAGHYVWPVTTDGTYLVKVDSTVSPATIEVLSGGSTLDTSTLSDSLSFDGDFRFAWSVKDGTSAGTIRTNMGNEAWAVAPTGGFGGVPNITMNVPVGFDVQVGLDNGYMLGGNYSQIVETTRHGSLAYCYSDFAKSSGQWRFAMGVATNGVARIGLCKNGHTGLLGTGSDSFGFYFDLGTGGNPSYLVIESTWAGTLRIPHPFYVLDRKIIFVCDFDAHTVQIWGKPQFSDYILLETLTGLPAGAYVPGGNYAIEIIPDSSDVPGTPSWVLTV